MAICFERLLESIHHTPIISDRASESINEYNENITAMIRYYTYTYTKADFLKIQVSYIQTPAKSIGLTNVLAYVFAHVKPSPIPTPRRVFICYISYCYNIYISVSILAQYVYRIHVQKRTCTTRKRKEKLKQILSSLAIY